MQNNPEYQRGYREGAEKMREDAASAWDECCFDAVGETIDIGKSIRKLPITPPQPAAQVEDNEREMREAFEKWAGREYRNAATYTTRDYKMGLAAWKAAWKEARK